MIVAGQRKKELLLYLSKKRDFTTAEELAEVLDTSVKTIYRLIKKLNEDLTSGNLVFSEKGRGYKLNYDAYVAISNELKVKRNNLTPEDRRSKVMEELLLRSPKTIGINNLFEQYYVSDPVISNDEKIISDILKKYNLKYIRRNKEVRIVGNEVDIRKAISNIATTINSIDIEEMKKNTRLSIDEYDAIFVLDQLRFIEKEVCAEIPYPYNVNISSHLRILIGRVRKSGIVLNYITEFSDEEINIKQLNIEVYNIAKKVVDNIGEYLNFTLPSEEVYYLFQYLLSTRITENKIVVSATNPIVKEVTDVYLEKMGSVYGISKNIDEIYRDLIQHIKPMINRLNNNIVIKNTLLDDIKSEYLNVFNIVKKISNEISSLFSLPEISDDENGFITLYFARVLEENPKKVKTLIMCTTGVGTSELLKVKVKKKFTDLEIVDVISTREFTNSLEKYKGIELILTTLDLPQKFNIETIVVSAMFTSVDQERVKEKIEVLKNGIL